MTIKRKRSRSWREELQELIDRSPDASRHITQFARENGYHGAYLLTMLNEIQKVYQPYTISNTRPIAQAPAMIVDSPDYRRLIHQEEVLDILESREDLWNSFIQPVPAGIAEYVLQHHCLAAIFECARGEISVYRVFERRPHHSGTADGTTSENPEEPDFRKEEKEEPRNSFLLAMNSDGFVKSVSYSFPDPIPFDELGYITELFSRRCPCADNSQDDTFPHPGGAADWEKNCEYSRHRTEEFINRIHSTPEVPEAVTEFAKENGYAGAFFLGDNDGLQLYQPYPDPDRPPVTGPLSIILFQAESPRLTRLYEALDIMDDMAAREDFRFIQSMPEEVLEQLGGMYLTAVYRGYWNGYQIYDPYFYDWRAIRYTGFPSLILYRDGKAHDFCSPATLDILDYLDRSRTKKSWNEAWHDELQRRLGKTDRSTPGAVRNFARKLGYEGAYHLADWKTLPPGPGRSEQEFPHLGNSCDFEIYQPYNYQEVALRLGRPVMLLKPPGKKRGQRSSVIEASFEEVLEIMERLLVRQEKDGIEDLSIHFAPADVLALARKHGQITAVFDSSCHNGDEDYFDFYRTYPRNSSNRAGSPNALFKHHGDADRPGDLEWIRGIPSGLHPGLWY